MEKYKMLCALNQKAQFGEEITEEGTYEIPSGRKRRTGKDMEL